MTYIVSHRVMQYCKYAKTHMVAGSGSFRFYLVNLRGVNQFGLFRGGSYIIYTTAILYCYTHLSTPTEKPYITVLSLTMIITVLSLTIIIINSLQCRI